MHKVVNTRTLGLLERIGLGADSLKIGMFADELFHLKVIQSIYLSYSWFTMCLVNIYQFKL